MNAFDWMVFVILIRLLEQDRTRAAEILLNALLVVVVIVVIIVVVVVFFFFVRWFVRVESVLTILKRIDILCGNCINCIWNWKQIPPQKSASTGR